MYTPRAPHIPGHQLEQVIGTGGFATVYRARQPSLGRTVAVKVMSHATDPDALSRFHRECRALGMLSGHPNIVTVHDCGTTEDGRAWLSMALEEGGTLRSRIDHAGPTPWREAVEVAGTVAGALAAAHDAGVLHRDVKPANVLVSRYGGVRLADFGIARVAGMGHTTTGQVTASVAHAAPEVLDGRCPSVASDLWSLGTTLVTLLTGMPPFGDDRDGLVPLMARIAMAEVPSYAILGIPSALQELIEELLDRDPARRPASAATVQARLTSILDEGQEPIEAPASPRRARAGLLARLCTVALAGVLAGGLGMAGLQATTEDEDITVAEAASVAAVEAEPAADPPPRDRPAGGRGGGA